MMSTVSTIFNKATFNKVITLPIHNYELIKSWFFQIIIKIPLVTIRKMDNVQEYSEDTRNLDTYVYTCHLQNIVLS